MRNKTRRYTNQRGFEGADPNIIVDKITSNKEVWLDYAHGRVRLNLEIQGNVLKVQ